MIKDIKTDLKQHKQFITTKKNSSVQIETILIVSGMMIAAITISLLVPLAF